MGILRQANFCFVRSICHGEVETGRRPAEECGGDEVLHVRPQCLSGSLAGLEEAQCWSFHRHGRESHANVKNFDPSHSPLW